MEALRNMTIGEILGLLVFLLLAALVAIPLWRQARRQTERMLIMRRLEKSRGSRVITLIHRQEALSFLGIPFYRYIDMEDSEQILRAIHLTPDETPIDLIIHSPGGLVLATEQIAHALRQHKGKVTVMVPHYAMSGGTLIALAASEIMMDANAVLGPVDPQLQTSDGNLPATSILRVTRWLLSDRLSIDQAERIASHLAEGSWTHDAPLPVEVLLEIGLKVTVGLPEEVYQLMELYPQASVRRPSVQFIPLPYEKKDEVKKK
jgi:ClpP class serine protease